MAFQSGAVFSEVTLFPKKRHSFGSTFFVFFPRRRFETQETVPTGIVARTPRSRSSRSREKAETFLAGVFGTRIQSASRGRRRKGPTELEFRVAKRRRSARSEAPTGTTGSRRVASSIRARSRERAACRASAGTRRATAPIASSSSFHRRTMDAWKRETRGFSSGVRYRTTTRVGACFAHNTNITCAACFREMDTKLLSRHYS